MKKYLLFCFLGIGFTTKAQKSNLPFELNNWKLELPSGYSIEYPEILNFAQNEMVSPFLKIDTDGALVFKAFPTEGESNVKYTKTFLREQMEQGNDSKNWSLAEGGFLRAEFAVQEISEKRPNVYDRTLLFQIVGKTSAEQMERWNIDKPISIPLMKIYWQNERLRIQRKVLRYKTLEGKDLLNRESWIDDSGTYMSEKIAFEKGEIEIEVTEGKIRVQLNEDEEVVFADMSIRKWPFEVFFNAGNYLQTKEPESFASVKFFNLDVTHE